MNGDILVVGLNAVIQKTIVLPDFTENGVIRADDYIEDAAGKATNVCRIFTQLGVASSCLTPLGDQNREEFLRLAKQDDLDIIAVPNTVRVRNCYTLVNTSNNKATEVIVDEKEPVPSTVENETVNIFAREIEKAKVLIITGSKAKGFSDSIIPAMVTKAKISGVTVFADYRETDLRNSFQSNKVKPDYVKINVDEFVRTFCPELTAPYNGSQLKEKIVTLVEKYNTTFIITNGSEEILYAAPGGVWGVEKPEKIKPLNNIGCGDTFLAGLVFSVLEGKSLQEAVVFANGLAAKNALHLRPGSIK